VLVVDDHDEIRTHIAEFIEREGGFNVVGQGINGAEAVKLAGELHPDVIFMDLSMPVMSGVEAIARIKEHFPDIRIVVVTIHQGTMYRTIADHLRVDGYVCKNSLVADMRTTLRHLR
jgi:two-component system nitrate/nitrite response regulator NarL